jgi:hypothetical protein
MNICVRTEEVDDEAAVGAAAGGVAEVGHAVGRLREGEQELVRRRLVDADVARVAQRVPEVEHGLEPAVAGADADAAASQEEAGDEQEANGAHQGSAIHGARGMLYLSVQAPDRLQRIGSEMPPWPCPRTAIYCLGGPLHRACPRVRVRAHGLRENFAVVGGYLTGCRPNHLAV